MDEEVQDLIERLQLDTPCSADELVSVDDDLAFCADLSDNQWEENFLAEIGPSSSKSLCTEDTDGEKSNVETESEEESTDLPCTKLHNLPEAITCLEDVHQFLERSGYTCESTETMSLISSLTRLHSLNLTKPY